MKTDTALMLEAAQALSSTQSLTAYAMASELMRSDGPYETEERGHLDHLALIPLDRQTGIRSHRFCV